MTAISLNCGSESDQKAIREQLARILGSRPFAHSRRMQRFLEYIVAEALAGRSDRLKAYNIALEVFDRPETFDPIVDPLGRVEAARLREKIREYYVADGQGDPIHIDLPKGTYTPHIKFGQAASPNPWPDRPDATSSDRPLDPSQGSVASHERRDIVANRFGIGLDGLQHFYFDILGGGLAGFLLLEVAFLLNQDGKPYTPKGLSNAVRRWCEKTPCGASGSGRTCCGPSLAASPTRNAVKWRTAYAARALVPTG